MRGTQERPETGQKYDRHTVTCHLPKLEEVGGEGIWPGPFGSASEASQTHLDYFVLK